MGIKRLRFMDRNLETTTHTLKDIISLTSGYPFKSKDYNPAGLYNILTIKNVTGKRFIDYEMNKVSRIPKNMTNDQILKDEDILISLTGNVGRVSLNIGNDNLLNQRVAKANVKSDKFNKEYIFQYLKTVKFIKRMELLGQGAAQKNIYFKDVYGFKVKIPNINEQEKIGNFLSLFDRLIEKLEIKIGLLKELKKGYLQQMFPTKGEKVPKIRFARFDEDWEKLELNEISSSYSGGTPNVSVNEYYDGDIPFIRSGEIHSSTTKLCISFKGIENSSAKMVDKGDILYAMYGANSGEVAISKIQGAINQAILAIKVKSNYNSYLLVQYLNREKNRIISRYLQGGQGNLSGQIIKKIKLLMAKQIDERNNIGNFFMIFDTIVEKQEKELVAIEQLKKGYMQRLFA